MTNRFQELRDKEVIHVCEGARLGYVNDLVVDICCGRVTALIVPGPCRFLGLFGREDDYVIPWLCIKRIGDDLILVDGPLSEDAVTPAKNAAPMAVIAIIAINLPSEPFISLIKSLNTDFPIMFIPPFHINYHSICSIGSGFSLTVTLSTTPFFTLITLSPIAVSARLCVITTTVTPLSRHVSCNSFNICLPVL